jgi:hydroxymethylpyrimidine/phosphomethylpyrimidine kinase
MTAIAVTIAGSDSGGGAGIQADLKTFSALGVYGASVLTALTAQNTLGVTAIADVDPDFITAQMDAVFSDLKVKAVKIGMLSKTGVIEAVASGLDRYGLKNTVLDPVMVATSGDRLIDQSAVSHLQKFLFPRALLISPNLLEAAALTERPVAQNQNEMLEQGQMLLAQGARAVLMKGGHGQSETCTDLLIDAKGFEAFSSPRIPTRNTHGTGCTLSSAIAAGLAKGLALREAVQEAKHYLTGALKAADQLQIGQGHGPVHHFHAQWT